MSTPKHTPGPHEVGAIAASNAQFPVCTVIYAAKQPIAAVIGDAEESIATAKLYAASPALYAALNRIISTGFSEQAEEQAEAALALARGETTH